MNEENIVIIGNGFDVNHGLPSSYAHFKTWLHENNNSLYVFLERYIDASGEWWNDFERNLSEVNVPRLIRETPLEDRPIDTQLPPSFSHPSSWRMDSIRAELSKSFTEWIKTLDTISPNKCIMLPDARLYVSFNYTDTLERVYGIDENKILYIHGKALRGDKLIYGHGKNQFVLERDVMQKYGLNRSDDFYTAGTYGNNEYQLAMRISFMEKRPYEQLVQYRDKLQPAVSLSNIVCVYGLSFSEVDYPYIKWIAERNRNLKWRVSWHSDKDQERIKEAFRALGVKEYEMYYM